MVVCKRLHGEMVSACKKQVGVRDSQESKFLFSFFLFDFGLVWTCAWDLDSGLSIWSYIIHSKIEPLLEVFSDLKTSMYLS